MAERIGEKIVLRFQAGCLARDDFFAQCDHRLARGHGDDDRLAELAIDVADERVHLAEIARVHFAQRRAGLRVVIHFLGLRNLRRIVVVRLVFVVGQPEFLHGHADVRIFLQPQRREFFDPLVGQINWREDQHIGRAGLQRILRLVVLVLEVPVLERLRAADVFRADPRLLRKASGLRDLRHDRRDLHEIAVVRRVKTQAPCDRSSRAGRSRTRRRFGRCLFAKSAGGDEQRETEEQIEFFHGGESVQVETERSRD